MSIQAISKLTGFDRKTARKYLLQPEGTPVYGPRPARPSKLDAFKAYIEERLKAGVWNAQVLLRELRARGFTGGYAIFEKLVASAAQLPAECSGTAIRDSAR